jgi:hypothetical protein
MQQRREEWKQGAQWRESSQITEEREWLGARFQKKVAWYIEARSSPGFEVWVGEDVSRANQALTRKVARLFTSSPIRLITSIRIDKSNF